MSAEMTIKAVADPQELIDYLFHERQALVKSIARGQPDASDTLLPSAWRPGKLTKRYASSRKNDDPWHIYLPAGREYPIELHAETYVGNSSTSAVERLHALVVWLRTEIRLVQRFCSECDRVALAVPGHVSARSQIAIEIYQPEPYPDAVGAATGTPYVELGAQFAFTQHYGIPTRLLDFSDDPLKAAYFAVPEESEANDFCIWIVRHAAGQPDESTLDLDETQEYRVLRSQVPYLHAQDGLFLSCNISSNRYFLDHGKWPTVDQMLLGRTIEKIVCPRRIARHVRDILDRLGINDRTMMPSYDTVARYVRTAYVK